MEEKGWENFKEDDGCEESLSVKSFTGAMCSAIKRVWRTVGRGPKTTSTKQIFDVLRQMVRQGLPATCQNGPTRTRIGWGFVHISSRKSLTHSLYNRTAPKCAARSTWGNKKGKAKSNAKKARAGPTKAKPSQCFWRPGSLSLYTLFFSSGMTDDRVGQWLVFPGPHLPWQYSPRFRSARELCLTVYRWDRVTSLDFFFSFINCLLITTFISLCLIGPILLYLVYVLPRSCSCRL